SRQSAQRQPPRQRGKLFILRPRRTKRTPKLGNAAHYLIWFGTQHLLSAVQKLLLSNCKFAEVTPSARVQQRFPKEFTIRGMDQRMRSKNLLQFRKRSAGSKQQSASRKFHSLLLRSRCKLPDRAVSQSSGLDLHPQNEFAALTLQHLFRRVIRLAGFLKEKKNQ